MPCGNRSMVRLVSRPLEVRVRFAEVLVRVTGAVSSLPDQVRVRDRVVVSVIRLDLVAVQVEAALLLRVRQEAEAEAEAEAVAHHRQALRVMEAEIFPRRIRRPQVVPVEVVVDLGEVLRVAHRPRRDRRVRLMTLRMFRMELGSGTLRINGVH